MTNYDTASKAGIRYFHRVTKNLDPVARPGPDPGFNGVTTFYETGNMNVRDRQEGSTMGNLLPLIIVGFFVYLIFFRKGGTGCCGGHGDHDPWHVRHPDSDRRPYHSQEGEVIDLREDQYTVLSSGDDDFPEKQGKRSDDKSAWLN